MGVKRIVDTNFWNDDKIIEYFSPEDKLFMLYLITNPHTTQLGIYQINKKVMAFELGYSKETIDTLLDRFENKYKIIKYSKETSEIAIRNYLKYSIIKGGKPVEDCLEKEIKMVKNKNLYIYIYNNLINSNNINETVNKILNKYNNILNDNDNEDTWAYRERIVKKDIFSYIEENFGRTLSPIEYEKVSQWEDNELTRYAIKQSVLTGVYNIKYIQAILNNYEKNSITTVQQAQERDKEFKNKTKKIEWSDEDIKENIATQEEIEAFEKELRQ